MEGNSSFSLKSQRLQLAWDSTSLGALKTCPRFYQYSILEGWTSSHANIHLEFGRVYHGALEIYDHALSQGADHEQGVRLSVIYALCETWDQQSNRPRAVFCEDPNKNRATLLRTIVWYLDKFENDPCQTVLLDNGKPAVELSFRFETEYKSSAGENFIYCGHLDRVVAVADEPHILDRKTTKNTISESFFSGFNPNNQFMGYTFSSRVLLSTAPRKIIVDAAQIAVTFSRFERGLIEFSDYQLDDWYRGLGYYLKLAEGFAAANYWPMNETACSNYGGCPFRSVCSCKSEKTRQLWLQTKFVKRIWDPLQIRGDI